MAKAGGRRYLENSEGVHVVIGEYTICGFAIDVAYVEASHEGFRPTRRATVTCERCADVILTLRGVRVATNN